jgi:hypothetical protein
MENTLYVFYASIVIVFSCLLFNIPENNVGQMCLLTALTALIIYIGQQFIVTDGKVKTMNKNKAKVGYHVSSLKTSESTDKEKKPVIESYQNYDSYEYIKDNVNKTLNKTPKTMGDIVSSNSMGPYDGKCLAGNKSNESYKWMKEPYDTELLERTGFVQQGSTAPLKNRISDDSFLKGPHLDGTPDTSESMFMFSKNQCNPSCCPSTYSCDGGCVCTTAKQREFVSRGGVM